MKKHLQLSILTLSAFLLFFSGSVVGQIAAGSYTIGTVGTEDYSSLKAACDDVNANGIAGDVTFLITTDLTENNNVGLIQTSTNTLTIKPATDKTPTIYFAQTADNGAPSGGWLLGITNPSDWANVGKCQNVIIDGSNNGTSSQDLTITNGGSAHNNTYPLVFLGDVLNVIVKNVVITTASTVRKAIFVRTDAPNYPHDIVIDNCNITCNTAWDGAAIYFYYHGAHDVYTTDFEVKNSTIFARHRGIFLYQCEDINIHDNEIKVNQTGGGVLSHGIFAYYYMPSTSDINIYNNKFTQLITNNSNTGAFGIYAIECGYGNVTYNIYNNFITGFSTSTVATNPSCRVYGIYAHSYNFVNAYHNTILLNDLVTDFGTGTLDMRGISVHHSPKTLKNNIVYLDEDDFDGYCLYQAGSTTLTSDHNDLFVKSGLKGYVAFYDDDSDAGTSNDWKTLANWQTASSQDANSVSKDVNFVSATDLHLAGASKGDTDLIGTFLASYATDIDGDARNNPPYIGADETTPPVPVELTDFTAKIVDGGVMLNWATATEVNNYGFEIEKLSGDEWEYVEFVEGHGNSNTPQNYSYLDEEPIIGKVTYRLKQVDTDGGFEYSNEISVVSNEAAYKLNQNYPNPFNPTTVISFSIKASSKITLTVYNTLGQQVATLVNEVMDVGYHEVNFDASNLASGMYVYKLVADSHVDAPNYSKTMKMLLIK